MTAAFRTTPIPTLPARSDPVQPTPEDSGHQAPATDPELNQDDSDQPAPPPPRYVRCPMLACGRLHELPPDFW